VTRVRNPWYYGWGIRFISNGMVYNVSGFDAVEIALADGRRVRLGTDEPDAVIAALAQRHGIGVTPASVEQVRGRRLAPIFLAIAFIVVPAVIVGTVVVASIRPVRRASSTGCCRSTAALLTKIVAPDIVSISLEPELPPIARRTNVFHGSTLRKFPAQDASRRACRRGDHPPFGYSFERRTHIWINVSDADARAAVLRGIVGAPIGETWLRMW
jgi:hypothetical protein